MNNGKRLKSTFDLTKDIFKQHRDWNARQIYDRYLILVGDPNRAVSLNAIQKHVQILKDRDQEMQDSGLDDLWHLGTLDDHPLPTEAVSHILRILKWQNQTKHFLREEYVTIREAKWIARLYSHEYLKDARELWRTAGIYSLHEKDCHLAGLPRPYDTTEIDNLFKAKNRFEFSQKLTDWLDKHRESLTDYMLEKRGFETERTAKNERSHKATE